MKQPNIAMHEAFVKALGPAAVNSLSTQVFRSAERLERREGERRKHARIAAERRKATRRVADQKA